MACRGVFLAGVYHDKDIIIRYIALAPHGPNPPFPLVSSASFGSARSRPGREAAKRTLDGEDRSGIIQGEGKGGRL